MGLLNLFSIKIDITGLFKKRDKKIDKTRVSSLDNHEILIDARVHSEWYQRNLQTFDSTNVDRSFTIVCTNGTLPFKVVSVIQPHYKTPDGEIFKQLDVSNRYRDLTIDTQYNSMLLAAQNAGVVKYGVKNMPDGMLKEIYNSEGVKFSNIYSIKVCTNFDGEGNDAFFIHSMATHLDGGFTPADEALINLHINWMRTCYAQKIKIIKN